MTQSAQVPDAPQNVDGRSTSFRAVQGGSEHYNGEALLVSAYAILWLILLAWIWLVWRKQGALDTRVGALEHEIDKRRA